MPGSTLYLLDTGVLLLWVRDGAAGKAVEHQFGLKSSVFRPLVCIVSFGEMEAFARSLRWGDEKRSRLSGLKDRVVYVDISDPRVIDAYADISSLAKSSGWGIFHQKNDLWVGATARVTGACLLTTDRDFLPLRDGKHLDVIVLDSKTGDRIP